MHFVIEDLDIWIALPNDFEDERSLLPSVSAMLWCRFFMALRFVFRLSQKKKNNSISLSLLHTRTLTSIHSTPRNDAKDFEWI